MRAKQLADAFATAFIENRSSVPACEGRASARERPRRNSTTPPRGKTRPPATASYSASGSFKPWSRCRAATPSRSIARLWMPRFAPKPRRNAIFAALMSLVLAIGAASASTGLTEATHHRGSGGRVQPPLDRDASDRRRCGARTSRAAIDCAAVSGGLPQSADECGAGIARPPSQDPSRLQRHTREGKSTVARSLGLVYAEAGLSVALVEADVRRPTVSASLDVEVQVGLTEVIAGQLSLRMPCTAWTTPAATLPGTHWRGRRWSALPTPRRADACTSYPAAVSRPNPPVMLGSTRMQDVLKWLAHHYDMVIIDSPPLLVVSDAVPLIALADRTLVVVRLGETWREAAKRVGEVISRVPEARPLGVIANGVQPPATCRRLPVLTATRPRHRDPDACAPSSKVSQMLGLQLVLRHRCGRGASRTCARRC